LEEYANQVINSLIELNERSTEVHHRLYREHCSFHRGNFVKNLDLLGRDLKKTIIIDNSAPSFQFHPDNAILIDSFIDDPSDKSLLKLIPFL